MLSGFNTNFRYRGVLFHVQTEDSGRGNPHVITLLHPVETEFRSSLIGSQRVLVALLLLVKQRQVEVHGRELRLLVQQLLVQPDGGIGLPRRIQHAGEARPVIGVVRLRTHQLVHGGDGLVRLAGRHVQIGQGLQYQRPLLAALGQPAIGLLGLGHPPGRVQPTRLLESVAKFC